MSHFTVMVIGDNPEAQLAPFHEFECTGTDDQYIQDIDQTEELRKQYEERKETVYVDANGKHYDRWNEIFYREPTPEEQKQIGGGSGFGKGLSWHSKDWNDGKGYRAKVYYLPEGYTELEILYKDFNSFKDYVQDYEGYNVVPFGSKPDLSGNNKYNYALEDESGNITKVIRRTNPNYKWDWYLLGGRWSGRVIRLKEGKEGNSGRTPMIMKGEPAGIDQARKGDMDFDAIRKEARDNAQKEYRELAEKCGGSIPQVVIRWRDMWEESSEHYNLSRDEKVKLYSSQKGQQIWEKSGIDTNRYNLDDFQCTEEEYIQREENSAFVTFAVVKDSQWYERGSMGWWGAVSNKKDEEAWNKQVADLLSGLPDDTLISIYDCHI